MAKNELTINNVGSVILHARIATSYQMRVAIAAVLMKLAAFVLGADSDVEVDLKSK